MDRLEKYLQTKRLLRELPFSNIRESSFKNSMDDNTQLRHELRNIKKKYLDEQKTRKAIVKELSEQLETVRAENAKLKEQRDELQPTSTRDSPELEHKEAMEIIELYKNELYKLSQEITTKDDDIQVLSQKFRDTRLSQLKDLETERNSLEREKREKENLIQELGNQRSYVNHLESENQELLDEIQQLSNLLHQNYHTCNQYPDRNFYRNNRGRGRHQSHNNHFFS